MQSKLDSKQLVTEIRQNLSDWQHSAMPPQYRQAKEELIEGIKLRVNELEGNLSDTSKAEQAHKSLLDLRSSTNTAQLLSNAVITTYERTKDEKIDPKAVLNNATDSIRIAWNLATGFAFDDSKSLKDKAIGFAKACVQGTIGMCQGALKGYEEGKGFFDTAAKMWAGSFDQGMKGYNKSLAMSTLDEKERAKQIIADIRAEHRKVLDDPDESPIKEARKNIIEEEEKYIKTLEENLTSDVSKEALSKTVRSLELLQLSNAATSLQSTGLTFLHRTILGEKENVSPDVLEKLGKDTLNVTKNLNRILDDSTQSFPSKLWTMTKAYAGAAVEGLKSFFQGFEGAGLKEKSVNALVSGFSGFMSKFSESLAPKTESPEFDDDDEYEYIEMSPMSSNQVGKVQKAISEIPLSGLKSPSDEKTTKEDPNPDLQTPTVTQK
ncbi:hypothetical protein [Legionella sp. PC997]|uniref:hypothetical protein n=1 Tax=Legionella sp. PC997 TaxID=2755562 RepID=UPI0015FE0700|nr:hypothetical protein [Legionella sp. PC997]QMT59425.1 hypothetical protein HBNCFIEN_00791 [Legionella sp. PC997]